MTGEIEPHHYRPSWLHMGDCDVCGHLAESPLHLGRPAIVCNPAPSPGPLWDRGAQAFPSLGAAPKIRPQQTRKDD